MALRLLVLMVILAILGGALASNPDILHPKKFPSKDIVKKIKTRVLARDPDIQHPKKIPSKEMFSPSKTLDDMDARKSKKCQSDNFFCHLYGGKCISIKKAKKACDGDLRRDKILCGSKKCGCCFPLLGCVLNDKTYPDKAINDDTCMVMQCNNGVWEFTGRNMTECGKCTLYGDPHILPYDHHTLTNAPVNPIVNYTDSNTGIMVLSQPGRELHPLFGVNADFKQCWQNNATLSCVSTVFYSEPGITVEIILPAEVMSSHCDKASHGDPKCITKILVNKYIPNFAANGEASSFSGSYGTVLIGAQNCGFKGDCQVNVVGSQGISVNLQVEFDTDAGYYLYIYATKSLQNQLFGLCDKFTGSVVNDFTLRSGATITNWDNFSLFTASWKVSNSG